MFGGGVGGSVKGGGRKMEAQGGGAADESYKELVRGEVPRNLEPSPMETHTCGFEIGGARGEQGSDALNEQNSICPKVSRFRKGSSDLMAGLSHLLEDWQFGGLDGKDHHREGGEGHTSSNKNNGSIFTYDIDAILLEHRNEGSDNEESPKKKINARRNGKNQKSIGQGKDSIAFCQKNGCPDLPRVWSRPGTHQSNYGSQGYSDDIRVCGQLLPNTKQNYPKWDGYLTCPEYLENPKHRGNRSFKGSEKWELHAPSIEVTKANFQHEVRRWLTINVFTKKLAEMIFRTQTLKEQIKKATCDLEDRFLEELLTKKIVIEWGDIENPPENTLFIGNVFLHPEPSKERWRLIFHPFLFNRMVRLMKLQSVKLPRLREILKQIDEYCITLKLDLKCAFFQIGIEPGLFCFRRAGKLYTLTRLPMGSSISVLVAEALSLLFAEEVREKLKNDNLSEDSKANAFVDDIFVSYNPNARGANVGSRVHEAVGLTAAKLGVTLKLVHTAGVELPSYYDAGMCSLLEVGIEAKMVDEIEVLGVDYHIEKKTIKLKKEFQLKAKQNLKIEEANTPRGLWRIVGTCFYAIYALGICPARFPVVFKLLGRVAVSLVGAGKTDPRWEQELSLTGEERAELIKMMNIVLSFPTAQFERKECPNVFVFTDASNLGLGVVLIKDGKVIIKAREWTLAEDQLPINSKEVIAANWGVGMARVIYPGGSILLGVDNTAAFFDLINGYSREPIANQSVLEVRIGGNLGLMWVPTELMPADGPSRLVVDAEVPWKALTILNHTVRYVFLHKLL